MQLLVDQTVGDHEGYSGSPVLLETSETPVSTPVASGPPPVLGVLVEQLRWRVPVRPGQPARPLRHAAGDRWFEDETYVKVAGRWRYLYRAVDQYGQVIDVLLSEQRDTAAARRFFIRAPRVTGGHPDPTLVRRRREDGAA
jgi:hypothetical protein